MPIKVLDKNTIGQIAAGEVVERPASVVKELVENALDAGATQITVEARGGGVGRLRVTDNGAGIPAGEAALAFERHATSKITGPADLENIASLGFRGEALPAIAAVADVELLTRSDADAAGTYLRLEGGAVVKEAAQARARGTTVTVAGLFRRVPARLKFLKTTATENGHIANIVSRYALAYPEVAFELIIEGKTSLKTSGRGRLIDAVIDVYGVATAGKMLAVRPPEGEFAAGAEAAVSVSGMVGAPELDRVGRGHLSFFVNRRWVTSRRLTYAVEEAYRGLLMTGRHPVAVLNIALPPAEVDVNIHPAKSEVKFRDEAGVFRAVQRAVRRALVSEMPVPQVGETTAAYRSASSSPQTAWSPPVNRPDMPLSEAPPMLAATLPVLRVVGQVMRAYIVAEGPDGLYLIDQHAAHERIRYDKLRQQRTEARPEVQGLLEPVALEVTPPQAQILGACRESLAAYGFAVESFGERTYLVRAVPALLAGEDWEALLRDLLEELSGEARSDWEERILASLACHGAVRSGQALSDEEMRALVRQLETTPNPHTCPHGRPTVIHLSAARLERDFGRS